jgi:catechol 2,3-dioxygenase-like lactoylglutathione lyase family enzyme
MVTGFDHVHFYCGDISKAVAYFQNLFDGRITSQAEFKGNLYVRMKVCGFTIALRGVDPKNDELTAGKEARGLGHFGFTVDNLGKTLTDLARKGARIAIPPNISPLGLNCAFIEGPEGSLIELIEEK